MQLAQIAAFPGSPVHGGKRRSGVAEQQVLDQFQGRFVTAHAEELLHLRRGHAVGTRYYKLLQQVLRVAQAA